MSSNFENEYKAVRDAGAGILDFPGRGLIEVSGSEAVQFLNGLITNDVKTLEDNTWMLAAFPNVQGRLLAIVRVLRLGERFLFDTEAATHEKVLQNLFRFTFAGDFKVRDLSGEFSLISIQGKQSAEICEKVFLALPAKSQIEQLRFQNEEVIAIRSTHTAEDGFDLFAPKDLVETISNEFKTLGAIKIGVEARETLRIEAGIPSYGVDADETTVVLETGLDEAVSFKKGCYVGQEIIARIHFRGHVAKQLAGLILDEAAAVAPNDELKSAEGKAAGRITSTIFSPVLGKRIALALVRYEFLAPGTELLISRGEIQIPARVCELPFVRGSWYSV